MYGETTAPAANVIHEGGLSPHVRGNPSSAKPVNRKLGSIPACTGKPVVDRPGVLLPRVYPRMYGETGSRTWKAEAVNGLSPHVRGNPLEGWVSNIVPGSIPACTGKPSTAAPCDPR